MPVQHPNHLHSSSKRIIFDLNNLHGNSGPFHISRNYGWHLPCSGNPGPLQTERQRIKPLALDHPYFYRIVDHCCWRTCSDHYEPRVGEMIVFS